MSILILLGVRLLPLAAILLIRRGEVAGWTLLLAVLSTVALVLLGSYIDYLRGSYLANEYHPHADVLRTQLQRLVPFRLVTWLLYAGALSLLLVA